MSDIALYTGIAGVFGAAAGAIKVILDAVTAQQSAAVQGFKALSESLESRIAKLEKANDEMGDEVSELRKQTIGDAAKIARLREAVNTLIGRIKEIGGDIPSLPELD